MTSPRDQYEERLATYEAQVREQLDRIIASCQELKETGMTEFPDGWRYLLYQPWMSISEALSNWGLAVEDQLLFGRGREYEYEQSRIAADGYDDDWSDEEDGLETNGGIIDDC